MYNYLRAELFRLFRKRSLVWLASLLILAFLFSLFVLLFQFSRNGLSFSQKLSGYRELGLNMIFASAVFIYPVFMQAVYMDDLYHKTIERIRALGPGIPAYVGVKIFSLALICSLIYGFLAFFYQLPLVFYFRLPKAGLIDESLVLLRAALIRGTSVFLSIIGAAVFAYASRRLILPYGIGLILIYYLPYSFLSMSALNLQQADIKRFYFMQRFFVDQAALFSEKGLKVNSLFFLQVGLSVLLLGALQCFVIYRNKDKIKEDRQA